VAVWGTNFVVIKIGLRDFPPFLFALMRFAFCALPFAFFVKRPSVPWRWIALYGLFIGAGQFGCLFYAMRADITPGLASLVIQMQVVFTIVFSVWLFGERISLATLVGVAVAAVGLCLIGLNLDASATAIGVFAVLGAALAWGSGNIVVKKAARESRQPLDMLGFVVWASFFAVPPLLVLSLVFEGPAAIAMAVSNARVDAWGAVAWQVVANTLFGFAGWGWLLTRYDAAVVSPYALLVPVFGMGSSALFLGEPLPGWKLIAGSMVLAGLALVTYSTSRRRR
jgi:O-acetylserine/cysteine efflux transporter